MTLKVQHNNDGTISLSGATAKWLIGCVIALALNLVAVVGWGVTTRERLDSLILAHSETRASLAAHAETLAEHDGRIVRLETIDAIRPRN